MGTESCALRNGLASEALRDSILSQSSYLRRNIPKGVSFHIWSSRIVMIFNDLRSLEARMQVYDKSR